MTNGKPETVVSASLQEKNRLKTQLNIFLFNLIKSETSDSFVRYFDGHFAYLKTLDFYFSQSKSDGEKRRKSYSFHKEPIGCIRPTPSLKYTLDYLLVPGMGNQRQVTRRPA